MLVLKKKPLSYVVALETAVGSTVGTAPALQFTTAAVKATSGGNMSGRRRRSTRAIGGRTLEFSTACPASTKSSSSRLTRSGCISIACGCAQ